MAPMFEKSTLIFELLKTAGLLYEAAHRGPNKLMSILEYYSEVATFSKETFDGQDAINDWKESAEAMAKSFLEYIYNGAESPRWLAAAEKAAKE